MAAFDLGPGNFVPRTVRDLDKEIEEALKDESLNRPDPKDRTIWLITLSVIVGILVVWLYFTHKRLETVVNFLDCPNPEIRIESAQGSCAPVGVILNNLAGLPKK